MKKTVFMKLIEILLFKLYHQEKNKSRVLIACFKEADSSCEQKCIVDTELCIYKFMFVLELNGI